MQTLLDLLAKKAQRLEDIPNKFLSNIQKVQLELLKSVEDVIATFNISSSGNFVVSKANMTKVAELDVLLREVLDRSEYGEAVTQFAKEFNVQVDFNNTYFSEAFKGFKSSEIGLMAVRNAQRNAVDLLINTSIDSDFIIPIKQQIEQAVVTGARFREVLDTIQQITTGDAQTDGKILQYSKQIAHDTFAVADRSYAAAVAQEIGADWFGYSGGTIKTSRAFCIERHNKFFSRKEIEIWGSGKATGDFLTPQGGTWAGEMEGTNEKTIFATAGGYNCRHSIMAVSIFSVPIEDIKRAMSLGFYTPTDFEVKKLGL